MMIMTLALTASQFRDQIQVLAACIARSYGHELSAPPQYSSESNPVDKAPTINNDKRCSRAKASTMNENTIASIALQVPLLKTAMQEYITGGDVTSIVMVSAMNKTGRCVICYSELLSHSVGGWSIGRPAAHRILLHGALGCNRYGCDSALQLIFDESAT